MQRAGGQKIPMSGPDEAIDEAFDESRAVLVVGRACTLDVTPLHVVEALALEAEHYGETVGLPLALVSAHTVLDDASVCGVLVAGFAIAYAIEDELAARVEPERFRAHPVSAIPAGFWGALAAQGARFDAPESVEGTFLVPIGWSVARIQGTSADDAEALHSTSAPVGTPSSLRLPPTLEARLADDAVTTFLAVDRA